MNITLVTVGKLKETYLKDAVGEYEKRLSRYASVRIIEVEDEKTSETAGEKARENVKDREGKRILSVLKDRDYVIALAILGKEYSSEEMAARIGTLMNEGASDLAFIIGGSLGLSKEVLSRADEAWSFSRLTFPHQLMRVIALEQIYRSFRILKNEPYHK